MKQIIGIILIVFTPMSLFVGLFISEAVTFGLKEALYEFGIPLLVGVVIVIGTVLTVL